jgi:4-diphosphocytidyl-2-C-methyl-D-erythritol kinase
MKLRALAPGKVNLCLFLGGLREDGRHELVTLLESVSLADEVSVQTGGEDRVSCPGVEGPNIVSRALAVLRAAGWDAPGVSVEIRKHIPVAAGMGGGSADAAAVLRIAPELASVDDAVIARIARSLGADVPSQLHPGLVLGTGAGDDVRPLAPLPTRHAFVIVPLPAQLSTADVYAEADRLELTRAEPELTAKLRVLESGQLELVNDLEPAALSLCPEIAPALEAVLEAGAEQAIVCGSGPTVAGLFWADAAFRRAGEAAATLSEHYPLATAAEPADEAFGMPLFA